MMNKEKSLKFSFADGLFASVMMGFTLNYVTPFALVLGASSFQIGLLNAIPQLFSSFIQLKSADIVEKVKGRVRFITIGVFCQALSWIVISVLHFVFKTNAPAIYIALLTFNTLSGALVYPAWLSLMSDTVEKDVYGKYFAMRGKVMGFVNVGSNLAAGLFLAAMTQNIYIAFFLLFFIAGVFRMFSAHFLSKMEDIPQEIVPEKSFTYFDFLSRFPKGNFIKFTLYVAGINFATFLSGPFVSVYMLKELKYSYSLYTWILTISTLAGLLTLPLWGKLADKVGNVKIMKVCAIFLPVVPLLWVYSGNWIYILVINIFAVHFWNGFNLCVLNFIFDAASPAVRTRCIAYFNFTNGIALFFGALIGGVLVTKLPGLIHGSQILTVFVISGIARAIINIIALRSFKEVRQTDPIDESKLLLTVLGVASIFEFGQQIVGRRLRKNVQ
ncbi:MAG: hypothetical protein A2252_01015 [Elusimicrobia bacterium RIFOXYA2_FULL_39_19]|nr:MAG: hypothetical protein A2252_01015 [Elusimicrobia bacterium RIFOXYA2_FULL_39_19]